MDFEYAVVGTGLIGSAALKYLAQQGVRVVGIGVSEPKDWKLHRDVFASHFDDGRIVRILDTDEIWAGLAALSMSRFKAIEAQSGIRFHFPGGCLKTGDDQYIGLNQRIGDELGVPYRLLSNAEVQEYSPFFSKGGEKGLLEGGDAGFIDPRNLVRAQIAVAAQYGATSLDRVVTRIEIRKNNYLLHCATRETISSKRVLVAAGAFVNFHELLPTPILITVKAETVIRIKVTIPHLQNFPAAFVSVHSFSQSIPYLYGTFHGTPSDPVRILKIGTQNDGHAFTSLDEVIEHFHRGGNPVRAQEIMNAVVELFPSLAGASFESKPCILSYSSTGRPIIDLIGPDSLYVVTGCCGASAKSSDEIGRLAAARALGLEECEMFKVGRF